MFSLSLSLTSSFPALPTTDLTGPPPPVISVIVSGAVITINSDGDTTITITSPVEYAGSYTLSGEQVAALETTPINLVPAVITGNDPGVIGEAYAVLNQGLWAYSGTEPVASYQWQVDAANVSGQTDPAGYTSTTAGDVRLIETFGGQSVASNEVSIASPLSNFEVTTVDSFSQSATTNPTFAGLNLSASTDFYVTMVRIGQNGAPDPTLTLGGQPGQLVVSGYTANAEFTGIYRFTDVIADSGTLSVSEGGTNTVARDSYAIFAAIDHQEISTDSVNSGNTALIEMREAVSDGQVALVAFGKEFGGLPFTAVTGFSALQNVSQSNRPTCVGRYDAAANETDRSFSVTGADMRRNIGAIIVLGAS